MDYQGASTKLTAEEISSTDIPSPFPVGIPFRCDIARLASNEPVEDQWAYDNAEITRDSASWHFWGVYDGHAGWETGELLSTSLITHVVGELKAFPDDIEGGIRRSFLDLDDDITACALSVVAAPAVGTREDYHLLNQARAGSCALLAVLDPATTVLRVACVGDSRAVLGRAVVGHSSATTTTFVAVALSVDQTGFNPAEIARLEAAHPNEPDILDPLTGRLLGMAVTRAFGDNRWKWPLMDILVSERRLFPANRRARPYYATPPYMTAEPEITITEVKEGDFLIMASDGLWGEISSEDAVKCVAMWIEKQRERASILDFPPIRDQPSNENIPIDPLLLAEDHQTKEEKKADLLRQYNSWRVTPEQFVFENDNVATHLIRNILGACRHDIFCAVMGTSGRQARSVRDDITVQVIFFGPGEPGSWNTTHCARLSGGNVVSEEH